MRYYEDLDVGGPRELGSVTVSREEIREFAESYDPLPYHLDVAAAREAGHEGLITSGYHTLSLVNGVVAREFRRTVDTVAGLGVDDLTWPRPVYPGDTLTVYHEILAKRPSDSRPAAGVIEVGIHADNGDGNQVINYETAGIVKRRGEHAESG